MSSRITVCLLELDICTELKALLEHGNCPGTPVLETIEKVLNIKIPHDFFLPYSKDLSSVITKG